MQFEGFYYTDNKPLESIYEEESVECTKAVGENAVASTEIWLSEVSYRKDTKADPLSRAYLPFAKQQEKKFKKLIKKIERENLCELKSNPDIKILPKDKNLGPALLSTDWVQTLGTLGHLHDELSYRKVTLQD